MNTAVAKTKVLAPHPFIAVLSLAVGETWAGIARTEDGKYHHLVLLPGAFNGKWKDSVAWAKEQGGELPTRREQSLLFANLPEEFENDWYWSGTQYARDAGYAWYQGFYVGSQYYDHKSSELRARAVRRIAL